MLAGLAFGGFAVVTMLPLDIANKNGMLVATFLNRFAIGVAIGFAVLPRIPGWGVGLVLGLLLSLPEAIITGVYAPIIIIGTAGGALLGEIIHRK
jgi:hypothetical protein